MATALQPWSIQTDFYDFRNFERLAVMRKKVTNTWKDYRLLDGDPPYVSSSWSSEFFRNYTMHLELGSVAVDDEVGPRFKP